MKKWLLFVPFVLPVAWLACSSDDSSGGTPDTDAGPSATSTPTTSPTSAAEAGAADTGAPSGGKLVSGADYAIVYVNNDTIDARPKVSAVFDANSGLTAYTSSDDERPEIGAATNDGVKSDGTVGLGRWIGGPTAGKFYAEAPHTYDAATDGFHWAIGKLAPSTATPSTSVVYELDLAGSATNPGATAPGTVTAFTITFTASEDGGLPTGQVSVASSLASTTNGPATIFTGGAAPQVRGNAAVVFAGLFVGPAAEKMVVAVSSPVHAAVTLKKK